MSYPEWYSKVSAPFRNETSEAVIDVADRALVVAVAALYAVTLVLLAVQGDARFWRVLAVPAATFGIVTYVRARINAPRPYELYEIDPIIAKDTRGRSMPSRHLASAVAIACAVGWVHPDWGAVAAFACLVVAFTRIVGGVHFPRDIAAAAALSLACAAVGFLLFP